MVPSNQSLGTIQARRKDANIEFGLVIDLEFIVFKRTVQIVEKPLLVDLPLVHSFVKNNQALSELSTSPVVGRQRTLKQGNGLESGLPRHHAHAQEDVDLSGELGETENKPFIDLRISILMRTVDEEAIGALTRSNAVSLSDKGFDLVSQRLQNLVAEGKSLELVDQVELIHIEHKGIHRPGRVLPVDAVGVFLEKGVRVQASQRIKLGCLDQLKALGCHSGRFHAQPHQVQDQRENGNQATKNREEIVPHKISERNLVLQIKIPRQGGVSLRGSHNGRQMLEQRVERSVRLSDGKRKTARSSRRYSNQTVLLKYLSESAQPIVVHQKDIHPAIGNPLEALLKRIKIKELPLGEVVLDQGSDIGIALVVDGNSNLSVQVELAVIFCPCDREHFKANYGVGQPKSAHLSVIRLHPNGKYGINRSGLQSLDRGFKRGKRDRLEFNGLTRHAQRNMGDEVLEESLEHTGLGILCAERQIVIRIANPDGAMALEPFPLADAQKSVDARFVEILFVELLVVEGIDRKDLVHCIIQIRLQIRPIQPDGKEVLGRPYVKNGCAVADIRLETARTDHTV